MLTVLGSERVASGRGPEMFAELPEQGGAVEGQVQNLLDNLDWKEGRSGMGKFPPSSPTPWRLFRGATWSGAGVALGKLLGRKHVERRPTGKGWKSETPTQEPLSGNCRRAASHDVPTEPAHPGDPVQPHTAGLPLLRVPHPHTPMVSPGRPGLPSRGHLPHPLSFPSAHNKYLARPGHLKGAKLGGSWQISWVNPLVVHRRKSRPREGQTLAGATPWLDEGSRL